MRTLGMMNACAGSGAIEGRCIPARKDKTTRHRAGQKQKTEITRLSSNQKIRTVRLRHADWEIACVVVPVDGCGLSFTLTADAVVCSQEIRLLIVGCIVKERARA